jgi:hypothetical protein
MSDILTIAVRFRPHSPTLRSKKYLAFLRTQRCAVPNCSTWKHVEASHTGKHGTGIKASDREAIPLCQHHHQGDFSLHALGPKTFEQLYGLSIAALILKFNAIYDDKNTWRRK